MTLALVHDWLNQIGGAENVLEEMVSMYPGSPIYTSIYAPDLMPDSYREWDIRTLWMDRLPGIHTHHQPYVALYPMAWGGLDLSSYDLILSNKSGFCHGVEAGDAVHVCYCLAPTRYVWQTDHYVAREGFGALTNQIVKPVMKGLQNWDYEAAQRVDHFIAISTDIQGRIRRFYDRDSTIIFPPVDIDRFQPAPTHDDYYLVVSRLVPYKRVDLAVRACTELGLPLKVAGSGRDAESLREIAGPSVEFLGRVPGEDLPGLMAGCKAFIFPGFEDFGIAPVEAQAAGRPVIAYKAGGALDTIIEGETGLFFTEQTVEALQAALRQFEELRFSSAKARSHAEKFATAVFRRQLDDFVNRALDAGKRR